MVCLTDSARVTLAMAAGTGPDFLALAGRLLGRQNVRMSAQQPRPCSATAARASQTLPNAAATGWRLSASAGTASSDVYSCSGACSTATTTSV